MGKKSDYFENLKLDTENERMKSSKKLEDFVNNDDEFKTGTFSIDFTPSNSDSDSLNIIKSKVEKTDDIKSESESKLVLDDKLSNKDDGASLLEKCRQFTMDDDGKDCSVNNSPIYELKSIAEILKSDSEEYIESLSKKYHIKITDDSKSNKGNIEPLEENFVFEKENDAEKKKTPNFIKMVEDSKENSKSNDQQFEDFLLTKKPDVLIENLNEKIPDISDIDNTQKIEIKNDFQNTKETTIRFTPIIGDKPTISVSSVTTNIDIESPKPIENKKSILETKLEENDFDDFINDKDIENFNDVKTNVIRFAKQKRRKFFQFFLSIICLALLSVNLISPIFDNFLSNTEKSLIFISFVMILNILVNADVFASFAKLFDKFLKPDSAIALLSTAVFAVLGVELLTKSYDYLTDTLYLTIITSFILLLRTLLQFFNVTAKLESLRQIQSKVDKNVVTFISDNSVTYSMSKNSIEGDVLVAGSRKTNFVQGFLKYNDYVTLLNGNFRYYQLVGVILAVFSGIIGTVFFESVVSGIICASIILAILALPTLYFINTLPFFSASKKLNNIGAMIAGIEGANQIEESNATVISTTELFPAGTIVLKDMKILSNSNIDDIILRAASLTEAVNSTLSPIFKKIAKTNSSYVLPDSDTVKYEERLGLSGWVDNELLFIGNRTLMESHGIKVPSIEVDKQILKKGCFPIYLATVQNACALLIVKYNPTYEISKTLKKISNLGVTLLIDNNDPNINEQMIADYFGIFEDTIKIVSNAGMHMYNTATKPIDSCVAPASFKHKNLSILKIITASTAIKKSNSLLTVLYVVFSVLLSAGFVYSTFSQKSSTPSMLLLLVLEIAVTIITTILYFFNKP